MRLMIGHEGEDIDMYMIPIMPTMVLIVSGFTIFPSCCKNQEKERVEMWARRKEEPLTMRGGRWDLVERGQGDVFTTRPLTFPIHDSTIYSYFQCLNLDIDI